MNLEARMIPGLEVTQELNLAPQLLQWLKLLQLPTTDLNMLVNQELETNPALEIQESEGDIEEPVSMDDADFASEDTSFDDDSMGERLEMLAEQDSDWANDLGATSYSVRGDEDERYNYAINCITAKTTLSEHLLSQLALCNLAEDERVAGEFLVGSLDRRGYLTVSVEEAAESLGMEPEIVEGVLKRIQSLEPRGTGSRNLVECLLAQVSDRQSLVARIISEYLDALANGQYQGIAEALDVTEDEVMDAFDEIKALNPEPGASFSDEGSQYITPDVAVSRNKKGEYDIALNDRKIPNLRLSASVRRMMSAGRLSQQDLTYIRKKVRGASFLIEGIKQRQETMKKVTREIINHQRAFLDSENGALKPLTMARVANRIGVHETTVSRAIANKYMRTPRGVYEMKHFFKSGYRCADGSAVVPSQVKDMITELLENENKLCPLTDRQIVDRMKKKGITLARRTVAKYREELGFVSSKERHSYEREKKNARIRVLPKPSAPASREPVEADRLQKAYA